MVSIDLLFHNYGDDPPDDLAVEPINITIASLAKVLITNSIFLPMEIRSYTELSWVCPLR